MGTITDISKQKRTPTRVSVFIDGEFVCGLDAVTAVGARLKIGDEITAEELKRIVFDSEVNCAFERAVGYLSSAPRAKREIERYLTDKGYDREIVEAVVARLDKYRYIDDHAYAQSFVRAKSKKYGKIRLTAELRKKGISQDIISELLSGDEDDGYTEENGAIDAANKYLRSHKNAEKQKLKRFLAGRGFSWDAISSAVSELERAGVFDDNDDEY